MPRTTTLIVALTCIAWSSGCKQQSREEDTASPAAAPAATASATPALTAPPAATPEVIPPPVEPIPPPTPPPTANAATTPKAESLKTCCAALHKEEGTVAANQKSLYASAALSCDAIAKMVSAGTTKKAAALTQLRANLKGGKLPAGCD